MKKRMVIGATVVLIVLGVAAGQTTTTQEPAPTQAAVETAAPSIYTYPDLPLDWETVIAEADCKFLNDRDLLFYHDKPDKWSWSQWNLALQEIKHRADELGC